MKEGLLPLSSGIALGERRGGGKGSDSDLWQGRAMRPSGKRDGRGKEQTLWDGSPV
jgi:hypothetical protein